MSSTKAGHRGPSIESLSTRCEDILSILSTVTLYFYSFALLLANFNSNQKKRPLKITQQHA